MPGRLTIGIDLGGTQVRAALVEEGRILRRAAARTDSSGGPTAVLEQFKQLISEICTPEDWARLSGLGVSAPGPLDSETGTVIPIYSVRTINVLSQLICSVRVTGINSLQLVAIANIDSWRGRSG